MRVALYARVSTESQQARGTIGSQLAVLRERVGAEGEEVVAEFCDDGHSGARLDRPGLDALRDAAEAGLIERVWCLSADRLARVYAYQVIVLDELARHGVGVRFTDAPPIDDGGAVLEAGADQCGEHGPVRPVQAWSGAGAAQDGDLVPQHEQFDVLGGGRGPSSKTSLSTCRKSR